MEKENKPFTIREIDLNSIRSVPNPYGVKKDYSRLRENIRRSGFLRLAVVDEQGSLLDGAGLVVIARENNYESFPAIVINNPDPLQRYSVYSCINNFGMLPTLEQAELLYTMKQSFERDFPETKAGASGGGRNGKGTRRKKDSDCNGAKPVPRFSELVSSLSGISERSVYNAIELHFLSDADKKKYITGKLSKKKAVEKGHARRVESNDEEGKKGNGDAAKLTPSDPVIIRSINKLAQNLNDGPSHPTIKVREALENLSTVISDILKPPVQSPKYRNGMRVKDQNGNPGVIHRIAARHYITYDDTGKTVPIDGLKLEPLAQ